MDSATRGPMYGPLAQLMCLPPSHLQNMKKCSSEWTESWKSTKSSGNGGVCFEENDQQGNEEQSKSKWGASWKYFNCQFHSISNSSKVSEWVEAWKISKPFKYPDESLETLDNMHYGPLDPYVHGVIIPVYRADKYKLWSAHFCAGNTTLSEWEKSWEAAKNMTVLSTVKLRKKEEPKGEGKKGEETKVDESEPDGSPKRLKPRDKWEILQKRMNPLAECNFPYEWNEAWKLPKSHPNKSYCAIQDNVLNGSVILQSYLKKICLADWKESWKCSRSRPSFGRPSATEWKDSSLLGYELRQSKGQWIRERGIDKPQDMSDKFEVFCLPQRGIRAKIPDSISTKEGYTFSPEWTESYKSLNHQIRTEIIRDRPNNLKLFSEPEKGETPVSDWAKTWKPTNVTLNPDSSLCNKVLHKKWPEDSMEIMSSKTLHCVPNTGVFGRSFNPDVVKELVSPLEWMESWRVATLQRHHMRLTFKNKSHLFAPILGASEVPTWCRTWKFMNLLPHQKKLFWDNGWETFEVEKWPPVFEYVTLSDTAQSEWSMSWKICGPQLLEWDDAPNVFHCKDKVLWSRRRCNNYVCSHLNSETLSQKLWGRSWRFMMLENNRASQIINSLIIPKINKTKEHIFYDIERTKPLDLRWAKAVKLAKTHTLARRDPTKGVKGNSEAENISFKWIDSRNDSMNSQMETISWSDWVHSWRFLLASYAPEKKEPSSQDIEMAERAEVTVYDNKQLRDQWESRAKQLSEKEKLEHVRVQKSALNGLFQEWNYRLALRSGLPTSAEKKAKGTDMSDFRKYVVTAPKVEQDEKALQTKFKVVSPPKKQAPPPPPPPVQKKREPKPPPPPRKERQPKSEEKKPTSASSAPQPARVPSAPQTMAPQPMVAPAARPTAYKDNLSDAGWNESWKILKPLINMEKALGTGKEVFDFNIHKYRSIQHSLDEKQTTSSEWNNSWTSLKNEVCKDYLMEKKPWRSFQQPESLNFSEWGQSWKMQNFEFHQQVEAWGQEWSGYQRQPRDNSLADVQLCRDAPQGWEESWKSLKPKPKQESEHLKLEDYWYKEFLDLYKHGVFSPGWNDSWKIPELQTHYKAFKELCLKDWAESWRCSRQHSWCEESMHLRYRLHVMLMSKRMMCNKLKSSQIHAEMPAEWTESWKFLKGQNHSQEIEFTSAEVDVSHMPLHLQFDKLNTSFPGWDKSWSVSKTHSSRDETQPRLQWKNSWKSSNPNPSISSDTHQDIVCLSNEHRTSRYMESETDYVPSEWSASWQTMKPPVKSETGPQKEFTTAQDSLPNHVHLIEIPLLDWNDSWRFSNNHASSNTLSLSRWSESWKFSNPNHPDGLCEKETHRQNNNGRKYQEGPLEGEPQITEWGKSWKYLTCDSLKPEMPREDNGEWGESWRVLNPQLYLKKEAWSEQEFAGEFDDLRLQLSFLLKEDKKVLSPELSMSEWNESWKFLKQEEAEHKRK